LASDGLFFTNAANPTEWCANFVLE
jgi:hypothetical protein